MQERPKETKKEYSNRLRKEQTRAILLEAARSLFVEKGYAQTGTPEIVSNCGLTRGALHHQFADKLALFRAVIEEEALAVALQIEKADRGSGSPVDELLQGADAYFEAIAVPGRAKLLLSEGPTILGSTVMEEIDRRSGQRELRKGLEAAIQNNSAVFPLDALATVLSAAFDSAAHAIARGESREEYTGALRILIAGIPGMQKR